MKERAGQQEAELFSFPVFILQPMGNEQLNPALLQGGLAPAWPNQLQVTLDTIIRKVTNVMGNNLPFNNLELRSKW